MVHDPIAKGSVSIPMSDGKRPHDKCQNPYRRRQSRRLAVSGCCGKLYEGTCLAGFVMGISATTTPTLLDVQVMKLSGLVENLLVCADYIVSVYVAMRTHLESALSDGLNVIVSFRTDLLIL